MWPQPLLEYLAFYSVICASYFLYQFHELINVLKQGFLLFLCDLAEREHGCAFSLSGGEGVV